MCFIQAVHWATMTARRFYFEKDFARISGQSADCRKLMRLMPSSYDFPSDHRYMPFTAS